MIDVKSDELREALAALVHNQWAGWMAYLFGKCEFVDGPLVDGFNLAVIPAWAVERWQRQMEMPYANLPEEEKESDRKEADRVLALIAEHMTDDDDRKVLLAMAVAVEALNRLQNAGGSLLFHPDLQQAISAWRDAEMAAQTARVRAEETEAKALQEVCHPEFIHPAGSKLTNEAARKAYATEQSTAEAFEASVLEAHARALRFWVEALIGPAGRPTLIHSIPMAPEERNK